MHVLSKTNAGNARRKAAQIYRTYGTDEETDAGTLKSVKKSVRRCSRPDVWGKKGVRKWVNGMGKMGAS